MSQQLKTQNEQDQNEVFDDANVEEEEEEEEEETDEDDEEEERAPLIQNNNKKKKKLQLPMDHWNNANIMKQYQTILQSLIEVKESEDQILIEKKVLELRLRDVTFKRKQYLEKFDCIYAAKKTEEESTMMFAFGVGFLSSCILAALTRK